MTTIPRLAAPIALRVSVARADALHFLGYPPGSSPAERIETPLASALEDARRLADPRGTFIQLPVSRAADVGLDPIDAAGLVIGLVTIGPGLERRVADLMGGGAATDALLLDAAGSAAVEEAADRLGAVILGDETGVASQASCRISPGYGRWSIQAQRLLFDLLPHSDLGVTLLPSMLMVPRKSISFAMWLGAKARPVAGLSGCARCGMEHCRYRRVEAT